MQDFNTLTSDDTSFSHSENNSNYGVNSNFENDESRHVGSDIEDVDSQTENLKIIASWLKLKDELNVSNCSKLTAIT